jgi:hypothetical protein
MSSALLHFKQSGKQNVQHDNLPDDTMTWLHVTWQDCNETGWHDCQQSNRQERLSAYSHVSMFTCKHVSRLAIKSARQPDGCLTVKLAR